MSIQEYVTSLEVSKRLAPHLPVGWESEHYWHYDPYKDSWDIITRQHYLFKKASNAYTSRYEYKAVPAPLLSEMLELLPKRIDTEEDIRGYYLQVNMFPNSILIGHTNIEYNWMGGWIKTEKDNAATAAAELFLWVKENGHIKEGA